MSIKKTVSGGFNPTSNDLSRRDILILSAGAVAASTSAFTPMAQAADEATHHGLSAFGDLAYPADFKQLKYVNANAPKGGTFSQLAGGGTATFNSFNGFILKGDPAIDMEQAFAAMMWRAADEPDAVYAYAADQVTVSADGRTYKFRLRDGITFHDGSPIKAEDVAFSLTTLKTKGHPAIGNLLRDMEAAEAEGDRMVVVRFAPNRARSAPLTVANLPILSKAYYTAHAFDETSMEPPLGSGPYKVGKFEQGRYVEFERVKDWWGAKLPITRGQFNFDVLRYDYYRDRDTAFEGFTSKSYTFREEFTSRVWATRYDFPAIKDGRVKRESIPDERPSGMQAWMINTRRPQFQDVRVRQAFAYAFDFEWANKNLMFDAYARTQSCFQNSEMMAKGKPSRGRARAARAIQGQAAAGGFRRGLEFAGQRRLRPGPPACCGGRRSCSTPPVGPSRTASASTPRASHSPSNSWRSSGCRSRIMRSTSRTSPRSASKPPCAWWTRCNTAPACRISTSTSR